MKKSKLFIISLAILLIYVSCNQKKNNDEHDHNPEKTTYYTCSMDPQIKEDQPGKCPICHMELTPMTKGDTKKDEIALSQQQIQLGNIKTMVIDESSNQLKEKYTGVLTLNQEKINVLASRVSGRIEKLFFKTAGEFIAKNSPIYEIYSEELAIAKQDYLTAVLQQDLPGDFGKNAKKIAENAKQKLKFYGLSESQINQIITKKDHSPNTIFYSTFDGYVTEILTSEGSFVMEGTSILNLATLSSLWLETQVSVNYSNQVKIGQKTKIDFIDFPSKTFYGNVLFVNPEVNASSRLVLVRIEVSNNQLDLKPGMSGTIQIEQSKLKGIYLPIDAVIQNQNASYVWVEKEKGIYQNKMVALGIETNGLIEIQSGLKSGEKVVISGTYLVNSEYIFRKGNNPMTGMKM